MIKQISFVVKDIGEFSIVRTAGPGQILFNAEEKWDFTQWSCDSVNAFVELDSNGFLENFIAETGIRISEQEAVEIWGHVIMLYGFLPK